MLGASAGPLIESNDVQAGPPCLGGESFHIMGIRAAFQTVHQDNCPMVLRHAVPMTETQQLNLGGDDEEAGLHGNPIKEVPPRIELSHEGHRMSIAEKWMWSEVREGTMGQHDAF